MASPTHAPLASGAAGTARRIGNVNQVLTAGVCRLVAIQLAALRLEEGDGYRVRRPYVVPGDPDDIARIF